MALVSLSEPSPWRASALRRGSLWGDANCTEEELTAVQTARFIAKTNCIEPGDDTQPKDDETLGYMVYLT